MPMKALVFGSCNLDYIYRVPRIVAPGETLGVQEVRVSPGGKGLNQAVALRRAGLDVYFAGACGPDGDLLRDTLEGAGVDVSFLRRAGVPSGQAHIQVDANGENAILLYRGANHAITQAEISETLSRFSPGDLLVLQNETSELQYMISEGAARGMRTVLNPSPFAPEMRQVDYGKIWLVFVNETEAAGLTDGLPEEEWIRQTRLKYPGTRWVVTLGAKGSYYFDRDTLVRQAAVPAAAVDTTCAGDTFTGFFTEALVRGLSPKAALARGAAASAITVSRVGAAGVIPTKEETDALMGADA